LILQPIDLHAATAEIPFSYKFKDRKIDEKIFKGFDEIVKLLDVKAPFKFEHMSLEEEIEGFDEEIHRQEQAKRRDHELQELKEQFADLPGEVQFTWAELLPGLKKRELSLAVGFRYMIDRHELLADSNTCEWAYIINIDDECLEIYKGPNLDPNALGRYASLKTGGCQGVALIMAIPFDECIGMENDAFTQAIHKARA
jgi:hypothetical protein